MLKNKKKETSQNLYDFDIEKEPKKHLKTKEKKSNHINSENEIIIGVTKYPEEEKNVKDKKKKHIKINKHIKKEKVENKKTKKQFHNVKKIIKWTSIIIIFTGAIIYGMLSPVFNINTVSVADNEKIDKEAIINLSGIEIGQNIFRINKREITKNLEKNGYIEDVKIKRKLPDEVELIIKERQATYLIEYGNGFVYINNQGYILEISSEKKNIPLIIGTTTSSENYIEAGRLNDDDLKKLNVVLKIMSEAEVNNIESLITKIDVSDDNNYKLFFDTENKIADLGDCSNLETRMLFVTSMLKNESGKPGEIFVNMNLNTDKAFFREKV